MVKAVVEAVEEAKVEAKIEPRVDQTWILMKWRNIKKEMNEGVDPDHLN